MLCLQCVLILMMKWSYKRVIEELKQDLEKAVDNSGWYGIVDFVGIRSEKGPKGGV